MSEQKIRLGIWGLGRGSNFIAAAKFLGVEIVAGCDISEDVRERFRKTCPDAFITADDKEFLAYKDMDAVLIATFFTDHAEHAIRALEAGFHVMCEVTSFFTPAQGVRLVEAVERSGKVYNLLENYPFTKECIYLAKLWQEGFFGDFQYGEFEYFHSCRTLDYSYNLPDNPPVVPGYAVHSWRSWLDFHYYNTHSLGPLMKITGLRPVAVTAPPDDVPQPGHLANSGMGRACPSFVRMSNGGLFRNLTGAGSGDYHTGKRLWGTRACAESIGHGLILRVGACGSSPSINVEPEWTELGDAAEKAGHGGGDFWEIYHFAKQIREGVPAPWNIYDACDVTLAGIMAVRSREQGGVTIEIPDFRKPEVREQFRHDEGHQKMPFDPMRIFPDGHDKSITSDFCKIMVELCKFERTWRIAFDGAKILPLAKNEKERAVIKQNIDQLAKDFDAILASINSARRLMAAYPDTLPAKAMQEMIALFEPELSDNPRQLLKQISETAAV